MHHAAKERLGGDAPGDASTPQVEAEPQLRSAVVLDPHPIWLDAVVGILERARIRVVGRATTLAEAISLVRVHSPDLLVLELKIPELDGARLGQLGRLRSLAPKLRLIVFSGSDDPEDVNRAFAHGAVAFVKKSAHAEDVGVAVRQVFEHSIYLAPAPSARPRAEVDGDPHLTDRELEILAHVADGCSNAELAKRLWVTEQTVKFHLTRVFRKLGATNRAEAVELARARGLLGRGEARAE